MDSFWTYLFTILGILYFTDAGGLQSVLPVGESFVLSPSESSRVYGHNVTLRTNYNSAGAKKSYVDTTVSLPEGKLREFYFYSHPRTSSLRSTKLQLQIWRPSRNGLFRLVYSSPFITVNLVENQGYFYTYTLEEDLYISSGDHIGWTNEDMTCPISFDYNDDGMVYTRWVTGVAYPSPGQDYQFDTSAPYPAVYSIAAKVAGPNDGSETGGVDVLVEPVDQTFRLNVVHEESLYGHHLTQRTGYLDNAAGMSYIDTSMPLPRGYLSRFMFLVHPLGSRDTVGEAAVQLQVWRPQQQPNYYRLIYTTPFTAIKLVTAQALYVKIYLEENKFFETEEGDFIGWTVKGICPISYNYVQIDWVKTRAVEGEDYPQTEENYSFTGTPLAAMFSVAAQITSVEDFTPFPASSLSPSDPILVSRESGYYGNDVMERQTYMKSAARKTFVNVGTPLPAGRMVQLAVYVHPRGAGTAQDRATVELQVWRPGEGRDYSLVWASRPYQIEMYTYTGHVLTIHVENFQTKGADVIGWTNHDDVGPISFEYNEEYETYFREVPVDDLPSVGNSYTFNKIYLPAAFSVAAKLEDVQAVSTPAATLPGAGTPFPRGQGTRSFELTFTSGDDMYGNNVTRRVTYLPTGAMTSYIDGMTSLPSGKLTAYYFFVHLIPVDADDDVITRLKLQIWRPSKDNSLWNTLVWSTEVQVTLEHMKNGTFEYIVEDGFTVEDGDRIGWTNLDDLCVISSEYRPDHKTYFISWEGGRLEQQVYSTYTFSDIHLPSIFSVAVKIRKDFIQKIPGGSFFLAGEPGFYGHDAILRDRYRTSNSHGCHIDYDSALPAGTLRRFVFFVHFRGEYYDYQEVPIQLQIWRPQNFIQRTYKLVYSQRIHVEMGTASGLLYKVPVVDGFELQMDDRLGWTNEIDVGPLSYGYALGPRVFYKQLGENQQPELGEEFQFEELFLPHIYSIAVEVNPVLRASGTTLKPPFTPIIKNTRPRDFILPKNGEYFGNDVIRRSAYLTHDTRTYIDYESILPSGRLKTYIFYIHDIKSTGSISDKYINIQIWRPVMVDKDTDEYKLIWTKRLKITEEDIKEGFFNYELKENVKIEKGDRIGWTNENIGVISLSYTQDHRTFYTESHKSGNGPRVDNNYKFLNSYLPSVFSVAVQVLENTAETEEVEDNKLGESSSGEDSGVPKFAIYITAGACALAFLIVLISAICWYKSYSKKHWPLGTEPFKGYDPKRYSKYFK